ncbi:hypothetical protein [Shewanella sp. MBTL60-007]|uniref:hypothetical protein n=1 Tax=Shewanella sp. MBTL60-007 TaxID=2815911 RepID=UPI001BC3B151|nr:hypothetical protein [Shewanella sp. MBTL60-007]GIU13040.1 hypothetical protein TUM3792_02250 [Shewanella sp. MBTL60-007]
MFKKSVTHRQQKATTAATVMAQVKSIKESINMTKQSLTVEQAIAQEANRVIASLSFSVPADKDMVESALESIKAIADVACPHSLVTKDLSIRLVAIRNNIHVNQIQQAA